MTADIPALGIINVPAGVITPAPLLRWLVRRREKARQMTDLIAAQDDDDEYAIGRWRGIVEAYDDVISHISSGEA